MLDTMLDHDIVTPEGWQTAWLSRTQPTLRAYTTITSYVLSFTIIALGLGGFIAIRRSTKKLSNDPSNRPSIFSAMNKKLLKVTRGHFFVANIYMLHVLVITLVDAYICTIALKNDLSSDPVAWNTQLVVEVAIYCSYLLAIFAASFVLVPLLQMLAVMWLVTRASSHYAGSSLATFIPEARFFSTHIAQIWCMLCFFVISWWAPDGEGSSVWRFVTLQACMGSAVTWLDVSFVLNFRSDRLADKAFQLASADVREVVAVFGETVKAVHGRPSKDSLPQYDVAAVVEPLTKEEKEFR